MVKSMLMVGSSMAMVSVLRIFEVSNGVADFKILDAEDGTMSPASTSVFSSCQSFKV